MARKCHTTSATHRILVFLPLQPPLFSCSRNLSCVSLSTMQYRVAKPSEYLVITGFRIEDIKLAKKAWILPGQKCTVLDLRPITYEFDVEAMSAEKLGFILPAVFTIGPRVDDMKWLYSFTRLVPSNNKQHLEKAVKGIIEGETRVVAASMTMEQIFQGAEEFKNEVFKRIQKELDQFGMHIYNANVKQLVDVIGHEYFSFLGLKTQKEAENQAKIDVAEAQLKGTTGAKTRDGLMLQNQALVETETKLFVAQKGAEARQEQAQLEAATKIFENQREIERAEADSQLAVRKAKLKEMTMIAEIESGKNAEIHSKTLQQLVERKNAQAELERLRAETLSKAVITYESSEFAAAKELTVKKKRAEAELFRKEMEAEASKAMASARAYGVQEVSKAYIGAILRVVGVVFFIAFLAKLAFFPSLHPSYPACSRIHLDL